MALHGHPPAQQRQRLGAPAGQQKQRLGATQPAQQSAIRKQLLARKTQREGGGGSTGAGKPSQGVRQALLQRLLAQKGQ